MTEFTSTIHSPADPVEGTAPRKRQLSRSQPEDTFYGFPIEIRLDILRLFSFGELLLVRRVCRLWREFIDQYYDLWTLADFRGSNGLVAATVVFNSRHKSLLLAEELRVSCDDRQLGDCEEDIFGNDWPKLRALHIEFQLPMLSSSRIPGLLDQLSELSIHIGDSPTFIRMLLGHPLPQLRSLWFYADWYELFQGVVSYDVPESDVREMRQLEHLRLGSADPLADYTFLSLFERLYDTNKFIPLSQSGIHLLIKLFPAISRLTITRIAYSDVDYRIDPHYISNFCGLCLDSLWNLTDMTIKYSVLPQITLSRCVNLTLCCTNVNHLSSRNLMGKTTAQCLQSLTLSSVYRMTNQHVYNILQDMCGANLTSLDLSSAPYDVGSILFYGKPADSGAPDGPMGSKKFTFARGITKSCSRLRRLVVGETANDDALWEFRKLQLLEYFEVKHSSEVSRAGILGLLGLSTSQSPEFRSTEDLLSSIASIETKLTSITVRDCLNIYLGLLKPLERFGIVVDCRRTTSFSICGEYMHFDSAKSQHPIPNHGYDRLREPIFSENVQYSDSGVPLLRMRWV
ncbi:hypothetical protein V1517DRAFT_341296 [Lipomyces orientalis]|uniref:Uncharacterized protein n=1 Tax=Lipomyces orientalis TaxID=1233043 RepID=A0ACC3TFW0_9ASCO